MNINNSNENSAIILIETIFKHVVLGSLKYKKVAKNAFEFIVSELTTVRIENIHKDYIIYIKTNVKIKYKMENTELCFLLFYMLNEKEN